MEAPCFLRKEKRAHQASTQTTTRIMRWRKGVQIHTTSLSTPAASEEAATEAASANEQLQITPLESLAKGLSHPLSWFEFTTFSRLGPPKIKSESGSDVLQIPATTTVSNTCPSSEGAPSQVTSRASSFSKDCRSKSSPAGFNWRLREATSW